MDCVFISVLFKQKTAYEMRIRYWSSDVCSSDLIVAFVQHLRETELFKLPGVAETIDWTRALAFLDKVALDPETIDNTLGVLLKYQDDIAKMKGSEAAAILHKEIGRAHV